MMTDQVFRQAALLAGPLEEQQILLLQMLCQTAVSGLEKKLREGLTPDDCRADFVAAASLYALAALGEVSQAGGMEEFKAGDLTVKRTGMDASSRCLQRQADLIIQPFVKDRFAFSGV